MTDHNYQSIQWLTEKTQPRSKEKKTISQLHYSVSGQTIFLQLPQQQKQKQDNLYTSNLVTQKQDADKQNQPYLRIRTPVKLGQWSSFMRSPLEQILQNKRSTTKVTNSQQKLLFKSSSKHKDSGIKHFKDTPSINQFR